MSEIKESDVILMAVPIYNFHVPAAFKAWIDLIARSRETFHYTEQGPIGLLVNKRAIIIITSGGTKLGSEIDFVSDYLKHILNFIGIKDVTIIDSSGMGSNADAVTSEVLKKIQQLE